MQPRVLAHTIKNFPNSHAGSIGNFGCLSFNGNKIVTSGGGGAILFKKTRLDQMQIFSFTGQRR